MVVPGIGKAMLAVLSLLGLLVYLFVESQPLLNDRSVFPSTTDLVVAVISVVVEMLMATGLAQKLSYMMLDMATSGKPAGAGHRSAAVLSAAVLTRLGPWDRGAHARSDRRPAGIGQKVIRLARGGLIDGLRFGPSCKQGNWGIPHWIPLPRRQSDCWKAGGGCWRSEDIDQSMSSRGRPA